MRGRGDVQGGMFYYFRLEDRVRADHPLRAIKVYADRALRELGSVFEAMYSRGGRPSIPPERLLKSQLLIALFSVRSDRLFCELLDQQLLFRWFLDMDLEEPAFDASTFSKNRVRLLEHAVAARFLDAVVRQARTQDLLSDEHFSVDGTLIEAWASHKSLRRIDGQDGPRHDDDDPGNPTVDFHGERFSNATHRSTTDPEARLARKGAGREAKLAFGAHALMDNRYGLCVDVGVAVTTETTEPLAALALLARQARKRVRATTVGADKGFHTRAFVAALRARGIRPHVATITGRHTPGLDGRTLRHVGYALSQRFRKRIEEIFGWAKTVGGLRKSRFRGVARTGLYVCLVAAAYNLLRMSRLAPLPT
jgi:transposase